MKTTLSQRDVVFQYPAKDPQTYASFGATMIACGGRYTLDETKKLRDRGITAATSVDCRAISAVDARAYPDCLEAVVFDLDGNPVEAAEADASGNRRYLGCTNHPAFRAYLRKQVCEAMMANPVGLHINNYLGAATAVLSGTGCFCDFCVNGFRTFLKSSGASDALKQAKIDDVETLDYRRLIKDICRTQEQFFTMRTGLPLFDSYVEFQCEQAKASVASLHGLARECAGDDVFVSIAIPESLQDFARVTPHCAYGVWEVAHHTGESVERYIDIIKNYRIMEAIGIPCAVNAAPVDWAYVKAAHADMRACAWIALAAAHGQVFMAPHRVRAMSAEGRSEWFYGEADTYAPLFAFMKKHSELFDGCASAFPLRLPENPRDRADIIGGILGRVNCAYGNPVEPITAGEGVFVIPRTRKDGLKVAHVVNTTASTASGNIVARPDCVISIPASVFKRGFETATVYSYDAPPVKIPVTNDSGKITLTIPEQRLWSVVAFEYWQ
jgi:hypothetical protein